MRSSLLACTAALALACGSGSRDAPSPAPPRTACEGIFCGASPPQITLRVVDGVTSAPIEGVTISNVVPPPSTAEFFSTDAFCGLGGLATICVVHGPGAGTYELDLGAPGYRTVHLEIQVPAVDVPPGACCGLSYAPQTIDVTLTRA
jgi:hypothetical protein